MQHTTVSLLATFALLSPLPSAHAEPYNALSISAGVYDVLENESAEFGIEYRFAALESAYNLIPTIGFSLNSDEDYWLYAGLRYDIEFSDRWVFTPHVAVSHYENGDGIDLGGNVQFRSGAELAYKLDNTTRVGLGIYHLSNLDQEDTNPGEESVIFTYSFSY